MFTINQFWQKIYDLILILRLNLRLYWHHKVSYRMISTFVKEVCVEQGWFAKKYSTLPLILSHEIKGWTILNVKVSAKCVIKYWPFLVFVFGDCIIQYYSPFLCDIQVCVLLMEINQYDINQYDITIATHYDITIGNDVARDIHCDVKMSNDIAMCRYQSRLEKTIIVFV